MHRIWREIRRPFYGIIFTKIMKTCKIERLRAYCSGIKNYVNGHMIPHRDNVTSDVRNLRRYGVYAVIYCRKPDVMNNVACDWST